MNTFRTIRRAKFATTAYRYILPLMTLCKTATYCTSYHIMQLPLASFKWRRCYSSLGVLAAVAKLGRAVLRDVGRWRRAQKTPHGKHVTTQEWCFLLITRRCSWCFFDLSQNWASFCGWSASDECIESVRVWWHGCSRWENSWERVNRR